ncbi:alcohol dehydrogenase catalytic domain-containing protein [Paenibacillus sp. HB172176]|uniref:zinc-dependent alcohol dehydrogenase n=1 Tax=Paenibacillus sp. HB172176 TaxID=2493690 RepID=UPI00143CAAD0|nr:alcohol dehydrogenase catalytic domain-containing protein [Paenibacillus sp. HB172176]
MKALVWSRDESIEKVDNLPEPSIRSSELLVRVKAAGVCITDIHMIRGELNFAEPPWILGHEISGVVERTGSDVQGWKPGDRVVVDPVVACGHCKSCLTGKKYWCEEGGELGTTRGSGGYGELIVVKADNLYRMPAAMSFAEGAMMEPLNCTLGAIERVLSLVGANVIVFGSGPAGLLFVQLAKAYGAATVTLIGKEDYRLALGSRLGADVTVCLNSESLETLGDNQYDVAIEASGNPQAVEDCFHFVSRSGTVVLYGLHGSGEKTIDSDRIVGKDLTVVTCISAPLLWDKGLRLVSAGKIDLGSMISHHVSFDQAENVLGQIVGGTLQHYTKAMIHYAGEGEKR